MPPQSPLVTNVELLSISATVASLVLSVVAIALSVIFYKMSSQLAQSANEAAKGIAASVERLEKLFDKLYTDTFSMMRDTVSDMRKHIWPDDLAEGEKVAREAEKKADEKVANLKKQMDHEVATLLQHQEATAASISSVREEMQNLINRAITGSRKLETEARDETIRRNVLLTLAKLALFKQQSTADAILKLLRDDFPGNRIVNELRQMKQQDLITYDEPLGPSTVITRVKG